MALTKVAPAGIGSTPGDGYRIGSSFLHSTGVELTNANASGIVTAAQFDGKLNIGIATFTDDVKFTGASKDLLWDKSGDLLKFPDGAQLRFGNATNGDLNIYHDGSSSRIEDSYGHLFVKSNIVELKNAAGNKGYLQAINGQAVKLYYNNTERISTSGIGATVSGQLDVGNVNSTGVITATKFVGDIAVGSSITYADNEKAYFGTALDLEIFHDGSQTSYVQSIGAARDLVIKADRFIKIAKTSNGAIGLQMLAGNEVGLYHGGNKKINTTETGVVVTGILTATGDVSIADKIVHTGDTNTAIRFPTDDTFTVETANTERFRIGSNGYIGVGDFSSKSRTDPLNVDSGIGTCNIGGNYIHLKRYSGGDTQYINAPQNNANLHISADDFIAFGVDHSGSMYSMGTEVLRIKSGGQALFTGVSGTTPLDIKTSNSSNNTVQPIIEAYADNATYKARIGLVREGSSGLLGWSFLTNSVGSPTERLRITSSGLIQISQPSPQVQFIDSDGTNQLTQILQSGSAFYIDLRDNTGNGQLVIRGKAGGTATERVRITTDGDISIGTDGNVHGVSKLTIKPANRTTAFSASDGDTWHDVVLKQTGDATTNAVGIAFEVSANAYHKNAGTGIACVKNGTASDYGSDLVFITRPQSAAAVERLRLNQSGTLLGDTTAVNAVKMQLSNDDHGNNVFNHRGNRTLHSNGTGWDGNVSNDGMDPILVCSVADRAGNSDIGDALGLLLHSESQDDNDYGPLLAWSSRSNSGNYNSIYGAIVGQRTGQGTDTNWNAGSLHFFTAPAGSGAYMNSTPDMSINSEGHITTPRRPAFFAYANMSWTNLGPGDKVSFDTLATPGWANANVESGDYNTSNKRFVAPVAGLYQFTVAMYMNSNNMNNILSIVPRIDGSQLSNGSDTVFFWSVRQSSSTTDGNTYSGSIQLYLNKDQYVEVYKRTGGSGAHQYYGRHSHFCGHLIG